MNVLRFLENVVRDLHYGIRNLMKSKAFTAASVITLALGIGVNSAMFSVVDAVMLRSLPYPESERLMSVWETNVGQPPPRMDSSGRILGESSLNAVAARLPVAAANLVDYLKGNHVFSGMAGFDVVGMNLTQNGPPERLFGEAVTADYFDVLGIQPARGRAFVSNEDRPGSNGFVIVSHELWEQRFASDPSLLGESLTLNGNKYRVIGIMPPGFRSPSQFGTAERLSFFVPAAYSSALLANHGDHDIHVLARLKSGVSRGEAHADLDLISAQLAQAYPDTNRNIKTGIAPLNDDITRNFRTPLLVLFTAVGFILLIACANLANLLLVRAAKRQHEMTIRVALGASRRRVLGELLAESAVLSALGSAVGVIIAVWTQYFVVELAPGNIPRLASAGLNSRVLLFTILLSGLTTILFGLIPAWQAGKAQPSDCLKSTERNLVGTSMMRWRSVLMTVEVAISMMLLVGAGLLLRSFVSLTGVELGFQSESVLAMNINLPAARYPSAEGRFTFFEELAERVRNLPGVQAVAFANRLPLRGGWGGGLQVDSADGTKSLPDSDLQAVNSGYFETLGIPLLRGRLLAPEDRSNSQPVAVINAAFARSFLSNSEPIGRRLRRGPQGPWVAIVGIVGDVHRQGKAAPITPQVYFSAAQTALYPVSLADFAFRTSGDARKLLSAVRERLWSIDKELPLTNVKTLDELVAQSIVERRFQTVLLSVFAALAVALALVGVYGVVSYSVAQRTFEIGIRIALGATPARVLGSIMTRAVPLIMLGIAAGALGAYGLSQYLGSLLFSIKPTDPLTYSSLALLLAVVAATACYIPAGRATRVDPMMALRHD